MDNDWLAEPTNPTPTTPPQRRLLAIRVGLVAVGALVGGVVVTSLHHDSTASANPSAFPGPRSGVQAGPQAGFPGPPPGGLDGEQHLSGTLVSVGSASVTVRTSTGTETYDVTGASQLVRNGQLVSLDALEVGDPVLVHVVPGATGSQMTVERLLAGLTASSQDWLSGRPAAGPSLGP